MSTAPTVAFTERGPALFVTTSTDTHHSSQGFRNSTGAQWPSSGRPPSAMSVISEQCRVG